MNKQDRWNILDPQSSCITNQKAFPPRAPWENRAAQTAAPTARDGLGRWKVGWLCPNPLCLLQSCCLITEVPHVINSEINVLTFLICQLIRIHGQSLGKMSEIGPCRQMAQRCGILSSLSSNIVAWWLDFCTSGASGRASGCQDSICIYPKTDRDPLGQCPWSERKDTTLYSLSWSPWSH